MRGILDTGTYLQPADAMDFVETILEASTEYSIIGKDLDGTILLCCSCRSTDWEASEPRSRGRALVCP
jgi:hypothetical protein